MKKAKKIGGTNVLLTVLLILGCVTVLFPLYMAVIIAFKNPSEMTNDIAGALSFPSHWSLDNFAEAMEVTNFWHTLGNSILITGVTIVLSLVIHSMTGYAIGRGMARKKGFKFVYFYIVSGMFVPFCYPDDASCKRDSPSGTGQPSWRYPVICCILHAHECYALQRLSGKMFQLLWKKQLTLTAHQPGKPTGRSYSP